MLLPKASPSSQENIAYLLERMELDKSTYQIGKSKVRHYTHINMTWSCVKLAEVMHVLHEFIRLRVCFPSAQVFLKEKERQLLQDTLNKEVMCHIITLQRRIRSFLLRLHYLQRRDARRIMEVE